MAKKPATPPAPPPLDPVTQYATDVVEGRDVAGRLVRLACQRHLDDLAHGGARGLVWRVDEAQRSIDFFPTILRLPENVAADDELTDEEFEAFEATLLSDGQPFVLEPWEQFIVGSGFGWYRGRWRRFRTMYLETAKGSGKTPLAAGMMIYRAIADGERRAQVFFAAVKLDQAKIPFADVDAMVKASPSLSRRLRPTVNNYADPKTGSFLRAISSEHKGLDGKRVSACHLEELHEHPTHLVVQKMRAGTKGRPNALLLETTNAGFNRNSVCWDHHELSRQVLEGIVQKDHWFAYIAQLDPCDKCRAQGHQFPQDTCSRCDDWKTEGPHWRKANPNLGVSISWEYLRELVSDAVVMPSSQSMVKRLNFGIWTDQIATWITADQWAACEGAHAAAATWRDRAARFRGRECYIGGDLTSKIDLASMQFIFPRPLMNAVEPAAAPVAGSEITRAVDVLSFFWIPERTMRLRAKEDNVPYPAWKESGHLFATAGELVNHDAIVGFIIDIVEQFGFRLRGIGVDQAGATAFITRLQDHFGEELVTEVPQGFKMLSSPSKTLEALVISGNLAHDGNPVMTWCITNMGKEENSWQSIRPVKLHQRKRIDGGVALIDALCTMERTPADNTSAYADGNGLMVC